MDISKYISEGRLESYILGLSSREEANEVELLRMQYSELNSACVQMERNLEVFGLANAVAPPADVWTQIQIRTTGKHIIKQPDTDYYSFNKGETKRGNTDSGYIHVESTTNQIKVHKYWRPAFIAVFVLSKIFLILSIYFYFKARNLEQQNMQLQNQSTAPVKTP